MFVLLRGASLADGDPLDKMPGAVPGMVQPLWFTPTELGSWDIPCSQLCGLGHFRMKGIYTIQSDADYEAWLAEEASFIEP